MSASKTRPISSLRKVQRFCAVSGCLLLAGLLFAGQSVADDGKQQAAESTHARPDSGKEVKSAVGAPLQTEGYLDLSDDLGAGAFPSFRPSLRGANWVGEPASYRVLAERVKEMEKNYACSAVATLNEKAKDFKSTEELGAFLRFIVCDQHQPVILKLAAIRKLGDVGGQESVRVLVENVSLRKYPSIGTDAINALAKIGDSAVPQVLAALNEAVLNGGSAERQEDLVVAILQIKGSSEAVQKWFAENEASLNREVRNAFCRYAVQW